MAHNGYDLRFAPKYTNQVAWEEPPELSKRDQIMAHDPKSYKAPTHADIQRVIAQAEQMRADAMSDALRKLASTLAGLFRRNPARTDATV